MATTFHIFATLRGTQAKAALADDRYLLAAPDAD
jgi:hypothetical protein